MNIRIRCKEITVRFKHNEGNSQIITAPYQGAQYFIVERGEGLLMIHFCRLGENGKNIVQKTVFWNPDSVTELNLDKVEVVERGQVPEQPPVKS